MMNKETDNLEDQEETEIYKEARTLIEALLFASKDPILLQRLREMIFSTLPLKPQLLEKILCSMKEEYRDQKRGFRLVETAEGYLLKTSEELKGFLESAFKNRRGERLSQAATEVLAIIAHEQPITKAEVEAIRGVDCQGTITSLCERGLIMHVGKKEGPGKPSLFGVTRSFLTHFGIKDLNEITGS